MKQKQNLQNAEQQALNIPVVMCCVCGKQLTEKENDKNTTYDVKERICDKCLDDELRMGELVMY